MIHLQTFALMEGEEIKCEVILPWHEMRGEITEYYFYKTLSIYEGPKVNTVKGLELQTLKIWIHLKSERFKVRFSNGLDHSKSKQNGGKKKVAIFFKTIQKPNKMAIKMAAILFKTIQIPNIIQKLSTIDHSKSDCVRYSSPHCNVIF